MIVMKDLPQSQRSMMALIVPHTTKTPFHEGNSGFLRNVRVWLSISLIATIGVACEGVGVDIRVTPLVAEEYSPKPGGTMVDELSTEPTRPFIKIAKLIATTQTDDEETVRAKVLEKAGMLGADAVIIKKVDVLRHMGYPGYQSTLDPDVRYSIFSGGPGSGMPMFFDPWTFVMSSRDKTTWTMFLSGLAIRYVDAGG